MAFPAVRGLRGKYDVHVACLPASAPVFELVLSRDRIIPLAAPWGGNERGSVADVFRWMDWIHATAAQLRTHGFAASFSGWCDPRVDLLACKAGIPLRAGLPAVDVNYYVWEAFHLPSRLRRIQAFQFLARAIAGRRLLTHPVVRRDYRQHHRDDWAQVIATAGVQPDTTLPWFQWGKDESAPSQACWLLHPGSEQAIKRWEMEKWGQLRIRLEKETGAGVKVIQGPGEMLPDSLFPPGAILPSSSVDELVRILAVARGLVCLDSFPAHLAAAMGIPVVTLFGRQDPCWFSPYGADSGLVTVNDGGKERVAPLLEEVTVEMVMGRVIRS